MQLNKQDVLNFHPEHFYRRVMGKMGKMILVITMIHHKFLYKLSADGRYILILDITYCL